MPKRSESLAGRRLFLAAFRDVRVDRYPVNRFVFNCLRGTFGKVQIGRDDGDERF